MAQINDKISLMKLSS